MRSAIVRLPDWNKARTTPARAMAQAQSAEHFVCDHPKSRIVPDGIKERVSLHRSKAGVTIRPGGFQRCDGLIDVAQLGVDLAFLVVGRVSVACAQCRDCGKRLFLPARADGDHSFTNDPAIVV